MTTMTTHATRLREIADNLERIGHPLTVNKLREVAADTAALEAKLAGWREVGQRAKTVLSTCHTRLHDDLTAMLADPDPLLIEAREIVAKAHEDNGYHSKAMRVRNGDEDHLPTTLWTLAALKRGIELGSAK